MKKDTSLLLHVLQPTTTISYATMHSCCPLLCHIQHLQKDLKSHRFGLSDLLWQLCSTLV